MWYEDFLVHWKPMGGLGLTISFEWVLSPFYINNIPILVILYYILFVIARLPSRFTNSFIFHFSVCVVLCNHISISNFLLWLTYDSLPNMIQYAFKYIQANCVIIIDEYQYLSFLPYPTEVSQILVKYCILNNGLDNADTGRYTLLLSWFSLHTTMKKVSWCSIHVVCFCFCFF